MVCQMKNLSPLLFCLLFLGLYQADSAPWTRINPLYTNEDLTKIVFNSRDTGLVISKIGELFYTHDGGISWTKNDVCENNKITNICFANNRTAFAFSDSGKVYRSNNGGKSWEWMFRGENRKFSNANFSNQKYYLYGGNILFEANKPDGLWRDVAELYNLNSEYIYDIFWANNDTGYCYTSKRRAYTTDRGNTWTNITYYSKRFDNFLFAQIDTSMCLKKYTYAQRFLRSNDLGKSWVSQTIPDSNYTNFNFLNYYTDSLHGFRFYTRILSDSNNTLNKTYIRIFQASTDGGCTWTDRKHPDPPNWINSLFFIDSLYGWTVGNMGYIYLTTNAGRSWDTIRNRNNSYPYYGTPIESFFHNDSIGTVFTSNSIARTYDKGNHWHQLYVDSAITFENVSIVDSTKFVISLTEPLPNKSVTRQLIIRSADSCRHFERVPSPLPSGYYAYFTKYDRGTLGPKGPFTTDAGKSWHYNPSQFDDHCYEFLTFDDSTYFWHTGNEMLRTTNMEVKWDTVGVDRSSRIISKLYDQSHAQLLLERGYQQYQVANTYDKGRTWTYGDTIIISGITPLFIQNENTFWGISMDNKYIYKSKDAGNTWKKSLWIGNFSYTPSVVMHFLDDRRIWVFLARECIFYSETGGE